MKDQNGLSIEDFYIRAAGHRLRVVQLNHNFSESTSKLPVLIFLHEALGSVDQWHDFPATLAQATGCNALVYDRWGHGKSDPFEGRRTLSYVHEEALHSLPEVLKKSDVNDVVLIGHSDGASIALIYASAYQEAVRGVISEAAHVYIEEITLEGIREAVRTYETTHFRERLRRYHGDNTEIIFRAWHETWLSPDFRLWNIEDCLPRIRCPVLLIQGEDDQYGTEAQLEAIARQIAGPSKSLLIPNCAHTPHRQARDTVVQAMTRFIRTLI